MLMIMNPQTIARFMLELESLEMLDPYEYLESIENDINPDLHLEICESLEICPIHHCALEICIDDNDPECALYRSTF